MLVKQKLMEDLLSKLRKFISTSLFNLNNERITKYGLFEMRDEIIK